MCEKIVVNRGEIEIQTVREFKEYFKVEQLLPDKDGDLIFEDCCLCQIDVPAELERLNIPYKYDYCDYYVGEGLSEIVVE